MFKLLWEFTQIGWSSRMKKAYKTLVIGLLVDAYLAFQFVLWPMALLIAFATSNPAHLFLPLLLAVHTYQKRRALVRKSICVKEMALGIVRQLDDTDFKYNPNVIDADFTVVDDNK